MSILRYISNGCSYIGGSSLFKGCRHDGVYTIDPGCGNPFNVFCDMKNGGWTVFQRRRDGSENFHRGWTDYVAGFGKLKIEFWLGLDHIHCLTTAAPRTELGDESAEFFGKYIHMYNHYMISSTSMVPVLTTYYVGYHNWTRTVQDRLTHDNGMQCLPLKI